ncbi:MAG: hypothetical protein WC777_01175 [Candidatus Gracilibacteria bacterium]|jgi:hypothetical protein
MAACRQCNQTFEVAAEDLAFYDSISPSFAGKKYPIPAPKMCPQCRLQRRMAFRNERKLYTRKSDLSGRSIISNYSPDKPHKIYDQDEWWSDAWDPLGYGRDFDFSRTFNEQFRGLVETVPQVSLVNKSGENSYYTNFAIFVRNCYLVFGAGNDEDCMYGKYIVDSKDCVDNLAIYSCELCYEGVASEGCYQCRYFLNSRNCSDCLMVDSCLSCKNCIACFGLVSKEYYYLNTFVGKERFEELKKEYEYLTAKKVAFLREQLDVLKGPLPHRQAQTYGCENCTGDNVYNSKNCHHVFDAKECEDSKYLNFSPKTKNSYDIIFCAPDGVEFSYNLCSVLSLKNAMSNYLVWNGSDIYYSLSCHSCNSIFGCVGLHNKQYCIFNKQYSKEEYEILVGRIIEHMQKTGEWGEFFDYSVSPFGYNETVAEEYFPLNKDQVLALDAKWHEECDEQIDGAPVDEIPEDIRSVDDEILKKVLHCEVSGRPYKITPQELKFYRNMKLPLPRRHHDERHLNRIALHNPYTLFDRSCGKCGKAIQTTYTELRAKVVYCEACYLAKVY